MAALRNTTTTCRYHWLWELLIFAATISVECTNVAQGTLYKAAVNAGLNYHVYMVYSYAVATAALLPIAYHAYRAKTTLPPFTTALLGKFFILGFLGFAGQYLMYLGISYSNPTLGSAMSNINPASTFCLAVLFRLEKLKLGSWSAHAKIIGTLVSISGALVVVLYNGPILVSGHVHELVLPGLSILGNRYNWILGGTLLATGYVVSSVWYIFQSIVVKEYPSEFILVFFYSFFSFFLSLAVGIASDRHLSTWIIPADVQLLSIFFAGIIGTGYGLLIHTWGLRVKGPVYVALFKPLSIAIAAIAGILFLGDDLYLGSVVGSIIIAMGFYTLMWGKLKEDMHQTTFDHQDNLDALLESSSGGR